MVTIKKALACVTTILLWTVLTTSGSTAFDPPGEGRVVAVFDGDTIMLEGGIKVRYLGIDTPEVEHDDNPADCFGPEAARANASMVMGKRVKLRYDPAQLRDRHGRLLAYVYLSDGRCVNEVLIRDGYGWVLRKPEGFQKLLHFLDLQRSAIKQKKGLWGACPVKAEPFYVGNRRSFVFHRPSCPFGRSISPRNAVKFITREDAFNQGFHPCRRCKP
ncbi:thermonuclease family protein [Thermodesulforhabdus norvegica]|uniref:Endonuclease YncB, thermonuclease family n=1 Tax=Thermodesulforhabdus norvegica TaxID=39841 RepID=A0A1I4UXE6_9BACT|nr:thermonuclease family protein [Thermodesulforhabdus norvegica]SFM93433.1 Endonuclease YncB, thermonuclease family [Thermodesulforhabdus norvegica]